MRVPNSARRAPAENGNIPLKKANDFSQAASATTQKLAVNEPPAPRREFTQRLREKVFNRKERYIMLSTIFDHLKVDDDISIKNIFEQYKNHDLSFVINQDENLNFGEDKESMMEWSLF